MALSFLYLITRRLLGMLLGRFDPDRDDAAFARRLVRGVGVAAVPGSSFYTDRARGRGKVRFAFPKRLPTLRLAAERLARLAA